MISNMLKGKSIGYQMDKIEQLRKEIDSADAIVIGAGAGLSTSAGFVYDGERFDKTFSDFRDKYGFLDMYTGGFYPYETMEEFWAYWSRYIYVNRYMDAPKSVYESIYDLVKDKDYFVITTNVDHCFQKAGFDKKRLFYTQGDYGLFQCSRSCCKETIDNKKMVTDMVLSQGFEIVGETDDADAKNQAGGKPAALVIPKGVSLSMKIPSKLLPVCPHCGKPLTTNLRADNSFVEDEGWHLAAERYDNFIRTRKNLHILYLELGVGYNTPGIIKYPFWQMTMTNPKAVYACVNYGEAACPGEIEKQSICINGDIGEVINRISDVGDNDICKSYKHDQFPGMVFPNQR